MPTQNFTIYANPLGPNYYVIRQAVQTVNGLQNYFRCLLESDTVALADTEMQVSADELHAKMIERGRGTAPFIAVTEQYYEPNLVVIENHLPKAIYITAAEWDAENPPVPRLFLIYALASSLITLSAPLKASQNERMVHKPPIGCVFDWWDDEKLLAVGMLSARICPECQRLLRMYGVNPAAFPAFQKLVDYVRHAIMGQETQVATKVFIAHGGSTDWLELKRIVEALGIGVVEYNGDLVAGMTVVERWREMLDESRYAFAILSPENRLDDGTAIARLNVAHEIGLCHARLGLESTAILREKSVNVANHFTNISGINWIDFEGGRLKEKSETIKQLLLDAGVLDPCLSNTPESKAKKAISDPAKSHLLNLLNGRTSSYVGRQTLRKELRQLRQMGLIRNLDEKAIGDLKDGRTYDLAKYVELTESGREVAKSLQRVG